MHENKIAESLARFHAMQREALATPGERAAYDDGVLAAGQFLDDSKMSQGSKSSFSARDVLATVAQLLDLGEITEDQAEQVLKRYRTKFLPAGCAPMGNYRLAQQVVSICQTKKS